MFKLLIMQLCMLGVAVSGQIKLKLKFLISYYSFISDICGLIIIEQTK